MKKEREKEKKKERKKGKDKMIECGRHESQKHSCKSVRKKKRKKEME